jgi:cyclopropane fatty-acyl-phospholipid synthase-like methyltransferase
MSKNHKTLLDIGAHWGYFDIRFAQIGMQCVAVEYGNLNTKMLTRMRTATGSNFVNIQSSIFDVYPMSYDVILALSIFHHFLLKEESYHNFLTLLHRMDCKQLFVEAHNHHEAQMRDAYMKLESAELIDLIKRESNLKNSQKIGETTDNNGLTRPIYELWR